MSLSIFNTLNWFIDFAIETTIFFVLIVGACVFAKRLCSATTRHFFLLVALCLALITPVVSMLAAVSSAEQVLGNSVVVLLKNFLWDVLEGKVPLAYTLSAMFIAVWAVGSVILLGRQVWQVLGAEIESRSIRRSKQCLQLTEEMNEILGLSPKERRSLRIYVVPYQLGVNVQGLVSPIIAVNGEFETLPKSRQMHILLHEVAHLRRQDLWSKQLASLVTALYWIIPAVWWAASRLHLDAEHCCDDAALNRGVSSSDYAESLIIASGTLARKSFRGQQLAITQRLEEIKQLKMPCSLKRSLEERLLAIIDPQVPRRSHPTALIFVTSLALLCCVSLAYADMVKRVLPPVGPVEIQVPIKATSDDAEEGGIKRRVVLSSTDLDFGDSNKGYSIDTVGLRFTEIDIPYGATISSATIQFIGSLNQSNRSGPISLKIRCQQSTKPKTFSAAYRNISKRVVDNEQAVVWEIVDAWKPGEASPVSKSPELKSLVQPLVVMEEWKRGSAIAFVMELSDWSRDPNARRDACSFDDRNPPKGKDSPAVLTITYSCW